MRFKPGPSASVGEIDASRLMLLEKLLMLDTVMLRMTEDSVDRLRLPGLVETVKPSPRTMIVAVMLIEPLVPVTVTAYVPAATEAVVVSVRVTFADPAPFEATYDWVTDIV